MKRGIIKCSLGNFPVIDIENNNQFKLQEDRKKYLEDKVGKEIESINKFLDEGNKFIALILGKTNSGKGTFSKILSDEVFKNKIYHISTGDLIKEFQGELNSHKEEIDTYRDFSRFKRLEGWERIISYQKKQKDIFSIISDDIIKELIKLKLKKYKNKSILIDGFPKNSKQIGYIPDIKKEAGCIDRYFFFIIIDIPTSLAVERSKHRRVCPKCQRSRNIKLFPSTKIRFDGEKIIFKCDNEKCASETMIVKDGDKNRNELLTRISKEDHAIKEVLKLCGYPKISIKNAIPTGLAREKFDMHEFTPKYRYKMNRKIELVSDGIWSIRDDKGIKCYSLKAEALVASSIKQMAKVLKTK